jgi:hypothetical protein
MTTYGVTMFGKRRHVMASTGLRVGWAKCCVDADYLPKNPKHPENQRVAAFPVCKNCGPYGEHAEPLQEEGEA